MLNMTRDPEKLRSCVTRERNCATFNQTGATFPATSTQQKNKTSLKALAVAVLMRNHERNQHATTKKNVRNFSPENDPEKLRTLRQSCAEKNSDQDKESSKLSISATADQLDGLYPCSLCGGNLFNEGSLGGYFCVECQGLPEGAMVARVVRGLSPRKFNVQRDNAMGVTKIVTIATSNKARGHQEKPSPMALAWLKGNLKELKTSGWSASELFRRNKSLGLAWMGIWNRDGLEITSNDDGSIIFQFKTATGQEITQTARPVKVSVFYEEQSSKKHANY